MRIPDRIAILAGGFSAEREISLKSAAEVKRWCDQAGLNAYLIDIQPDRWVHTLLSGQEVEMDRNSFSLSLPAGDLTFDFAYVMMHGTPGEDGLFQAYLQLLRIPFSTGDCTSMAISFHKSACKAYLRNAVTLIPSLDVRGGVDNALKQLETRGWSDGSLFVKPNDNGSSVGVSCANGKEELAQALRLAFAVSEDVMVERAVRGIEVSCGMIALENEEIVFPITEIVVDGGFFDYDAKYNGGSTEITPARIPDRIAREITDSTRALYRRLRCRGFVRADYIIADEKAYFLEVNTVPGMSTMSILPQQIRAAGYSVEEMLKRAIVHLYADIPIGR